MADDEQLRTALVERPRRGLRGGGAGPRGRGARGRAADLRPRADAEDLAAEALLRAYRALRGYTPARIEGLTLRPWLLTILLNTARNDRRDAARRPRTDGVAPVPDRRERGPGPAERAETGDLGDRLAGLLAELPVAQRTAVVLRHVVDLPVAEVAAVLGCARAPPARTPPAGSPRSATRLTADTTEETA